MNIMKYIYEIIKINPKIIHKNKKKINEYIDKIYVKY